MSVKLVIFKSGEDVIADISEMVLKDDSENKKIVGYFLTRPCGVTLNTRNVDINSDDKDSYEIKLFPWCPLSKNTEIPISADWVVTLVDPVDKVKQMYETEVLKDATSKGSSANEQSNSSESD